ncbi:LPS export ABC transporter permease LptG [Acetobacteraceae bacterium KSS8]|uniref:LPS export ABC transporter permease LptG n=1 Tax=Endosaccharibacter trunci TaxID=2812733 RepID=A0ABT1W2I1_9PROT|nr:LPS export ABC transporter permease LptG [Acetobacteraceae bacterium KSS8]
MPVAITLSFYISRQFILSVLALIAALTGLVSLFDFIDLLRRAATRPDVPASLAVEIAALHLPYFCIQILPFGVLLGGIVCFWRLTRSSELIVARAAGISAWQFLAAPLACAMAVGLIATTVISPLAAATYSRAEALDNIYLRNSGGSLNLAGGELWLRQSDPGLQKGGIAILHARGVSLRHRDLTVRQVSIFRLDSADRLLQRVEAATGRLDKGAWRFQDASTVVPDHMPVHVGDMSLPTDLTVSRVQESFAAPDTLSVWTLPGFIRLLDRSGFSSIRHRLHFQSLLALPLLAGTMALVSAGFSMRPVRRGGVARMIASGVGAGFLLFTVSKVAEQFGQSGALPPIMAAWAPAAAGLLLAIALLLHLEDG